MSTTKKGGKVTKEQMDAVRAKSETEGGKPAIQRLTLSASNGNASIDDLYGYRRKSFGGYLMTLILRGDIRFNPTSGIIRFPDSLWEVAKKSEIGENRSGKDSILSVLNEFSFKDRLIREFRLCQSFKNKNGEICPLPLGLSKPDKDGFLEVSILEDCKEEIEAFREAKRFSQRQR